MFDLIRRLYGLLVQPTGLTIGTRATSADGAAALATTLTSAAAAWTYGAQAQVGSSLVVLTWCIGITMDNFVGAPSQGEVMISTLDAAPVAIVPANEGTIMFLHPFRIRSRVSGQYRTSTGALSKVDVKLIVTNDF